MRRMAAGANRTGLIIIGLLPTRGGLALLAIGFGFAAAVVTGLGARSDPRPVAGVFALPFSALLALVAAIILAVIGLHWLAAQIPRQDAAKPLRLQRDARTGGPR